MEERAESERRARSTTSTNSGNADMDTDAVIGDDDEIDYFEAKRQGLI